MSARLAFFADLERHGPLPRARDAARVARVRDDLSGLLESLPRDAGLDRLIDGVIANSPYLSRLMARQAGRLPAMLERTPEAALGTLLERIASGADEAPSVPGLMAVLRQAKAEGALLIALADLGAIWTVEQVTGALSDLADAALRACVRWLLRDAASQGKLTLANPAHPEHGCGLAILAMGKYGARELNYSSDIDIVVFFDPSAMPLSDPDTAQSIAVGITRSIVKLMQETTADGYVFRTDLRLRPDAGSTQVAVSVDAAERYYEALGQNWERAAYIKARPAAGDLALGAGVLAMLEPFVWRRTLDYDAIADIHAIKRQIHAHKGHSRITVEGHNIKLGRGGIREIEFFAQTQQLITGGRYADLRAATTVEALRALAERGIVQPGVAEDLIETYRFLRLLEHRLQMVEDAQTHDLPRTEEGIERIAAFMGFDDPAAFRDRLTGHLDRVQGHYAELFETEPALSERSGSLVFTGVEDDPDTLETLTRMGFARPSVVTSTIRGWHHGRIRATRNARSREILTILVPAILDAMARTSDPDTAFVRFDSFLGGLPAGVQFFSLLRAHPELLTLLVEVIGLAPRFAGYLARNAGVIDAMLDPEYLSTLPSRRRLALDLSDALAPARDFEDVLDRTRRFARGHSFRIGLQVLKGGARSMVAGPALADLADTVIEATIAPVEAQMALRHGRVAGGAMAVIGMGKLGSREMSAASDLDLLLIYDFDGEGGVSDGASPLDASQYYARTCQRLINALTAPTAEGQFYEVDMRLRPSGRAGPLATRLDAFARYQREDAWTWERMALTRARVIAAPAPFRARIEDTIRAILCRPADADTVRRDAADMRGRMARDLPAWGPWDVKQTPGGLVDLEFIAQALQVMHAGRTPEVLHPNTRTALKRLAAHGVLDPDDARELLAASRLLHNVSLALTVAVDGPFDPANVPGPLELCLSRITGETDLDSLEARMIAAQGRVRRIFETVIGPVPTIA